MHVADLAVNMKVTVTFTSDETICRVGNCLIFEIQGYLIHRKASPAKYLHPSLYVVPPGSEVFVEHLKQVIKPYQRVKTEKMLNYK